MSEQEVEGRIEDGQGGEDVGAAGGGGGAIGGGVIVE